MCSSDLVAAGPDPATRARHLFHRAVGRAAGEREVAVLVELAAAEGARFAADRAAADALLSVGKAPLPEGIDRAELAAWTSAARAVLNLQETTTRN